MPVAAPADRRLRRSQVQPGKKRRRVPSWRTVIACAVITVLGLYVLSRAAGLALRAEALTVSRITVKGNHRMAPGEVLAVLDGLRGSSMVSIDLDDWRQKLLEAPWVADAKVRRVFPGTVAVEIQERHPLGIGRIKNSLYLIDEDGVVIDEFGPKYAEFDLPIIDGLAVSGPDDGADGGRAALAGRVLADLQRRPDLARLVSQIDVSNVNDAVVVLKDDTALVHTGDDHFVDRVQAYLDLAPRLRDDGPAIDSVDLRFGERVFVRWQKTAGK